GFGAHRVLARELGLIGLFIFRADQRAQRRLFSQRFVTRTFPAQLQRWFDGGFHDCALSVAGCGSDRCALASASACSASERRYLAAARRCQSQFNPKVTVECLPSLIVCTVISPQSMQIETWKERWKPGPFIEQMVSLRGCLQLRELIAFCSNQSAGCPI